MRHYSLNQILELPHLSDFFMEDGVLKPEYMVTKLGLYNAVIIDTFELTWGEKEYEDADNPNWIHSDEVTLVSKDVQVLHRLLTLTDSIILPCAECKKQLAFIPQKRTALSSVLLEKIPFYNFGDDILWSGSDYDDVILKSYDSPNNRRRIAEQCVRGILNHVCNFRQAFTCSLIKEHIIFSDFVLRRACDLCKLPNDLKHYNEKKKDNPNLNMTEQEQGIAEQYERLQYCLILEKVGQDPSMADLQLFDIKKYRHVLSSERFRDFTMALGLYASGVGCGSMLYLRRVYESVIDTIAKRCESKAGWDTNAYSQKHFNQKIEYINCFDENIIPIELVSIKDKIYSCLSMGVHNMSEDDAIRLFPDMKLAIELILDEQLAQKEKKRKIAEMRSRVERVQPS